MHPLQIQHLSTWQLQPFGEILRTLPKADGQYTQWEISFTQDTQLAQYEAADRIILDYNSGMSALILYTDSHPEAFYLDRIISLKAGTRFSILPINEVCCINFLTLQNTPLTPVAYIPASVLKTAPKGLQFEKIYTFLYQQCRHNFYFRGERHLPYELVYVDHGQLHNLVCGQDILLGQQDCMIINSNDWHTQYSDLAVNFLTVSFWAADPAISSIANKPFSLTPQLNSIFQKMLTQSRQEFYSNDYTESLLKLLLLELLHKSDGQPRPYHLAADHSENEIVDRAIQTISENIHRKLSLEELASAIHVSVPYLYMLFQDHLGTSPGKYIAKIRIEECKLLLRDRQMSMGQIAEHMGFSSLQHFSRQFRNICGMTPTEYLHSLR